MLTIEEFYQPKSADQIVQIVNFLFVSTPPISIGNTAFGKVIKGMEYVDKIKRGDPNSGAVADPDKIISLRSK